VSALGAMMRVARRDARRARARSALVVAMIALPVLGVGAADVLWRTFQLSPDQKATRLMGAADAQLYFTGTAPVTQRADGTYDGGKDAREVRPVRPSAVLPAGSRVLADHLDEIALTAGDVTTRGQVRDLDTTDPLARGLFLPRTGRAARAADEVVLTTTFARRLGVGVGDRVTRGSATLRVVGVVADASRTDALTALLAPGSLAASSGSLQQLVETARPLRWEDVRRANAAGYLLLPRSPVPGTPPMPSVAGVSTGTITAVSLVVGMVVLEVVLLAGPAFAVGAKRQGRELALLSATGADRRHVRSVVLGGGIVLGGLGGLVGVLAGTAVGRALLPALSRRTGDVPGPFDVRPLDLGLLVLVGCTTAVLAALIPARSAARQDVVAALTGRRGQLRSLKRTPLLGLLAAAAGTALALHGARQRSVNTILAGSALAELGLVATTPFLVVIVGRLSPWLPVGPRLALRDASRNRGRTAPAVSAVLAAVAGSVAIGTYLASLDQYDREAYAPSAPLGTVTVPLDQAETRPKAAAVAAAVRQVLPEARVLVVSGLGPRDTATGSVFLDVAQRVQSCSVRAGGGPPTRQQLLVASRDPGCNGHAPSSLLAGRQLVGGSEVVAAVTGRTDPSFGDLLARGGAVVPPGAVHGQGTATLGLVGPGERRGPTFEVPATPLPLSGLQATVLSPEAARRTGLPVVVVGVVAIGDRPPTSAEEDRLRKAMQDLSVPSPYVERGYTSSRGLGLLALAIGSAIVVLGASGIATGLAAADGRADLATLAAVGASPGARRSLAAFQSAVTAGLGTLLGAAAGLVPAVGMVRALNAAALQAPFPRLDPYPLVLPWANLGITLLVVPLLAAAAAAMLTRPRLPMVRRLA
jgi:putative ABC transport system permease protein